ncbi:hypothetical protein JTE90_005539 [Oedothorax gibbosus]|uniref:Uncharacterized protein n=1 Tax=Oedothorax gibbosus TaxID=931172 RepID=A0AAV6V993_9ARAC|nr:hypothetical protein JTE90_005539 [Oedothorax gibbosus]
MQTRAYRIAEEAISIKDMGKLVIPSANQISKNALVVTFMCDISSTPRQHYLNDPEITPPFVQYVRPSPITAGPNRCNLLSHLQTHNHNKERPRIICQNQVVQNLFVLIVDLQKTHSIQRDLGSDCDNSGLVQKGVLLSRSDE